MITPAVCITLATLLAHCGAVPLSNLAHSDIDVFVGTKPEQAWSGVPDRCVFLNRDDCNPKTQLLSQKQRLDFCILHDDESDDYCRTNIALMIDYFGDPSWPIIQSIRLSIARLLSCSTDYEDREFLQQEYWEIYDPQSVSESEPVRLLRNALVAKILKVFLRDFKKLDKVEIHFLYEAAFTNYYLNRSDETAKKMYIFLLYWFRDLGIITRNENIFRLLNPKKEKLKNSYSKFEEIGIRGAFNAISSGALTSEDIACLSCWEASTENELLSYQINALTVQLKNLEALEAAWQTTQAADTRWLAQQMLP